MEREFTEDVHRTIDGVESMVSIRDLNVWYGEFHALKHITLEIPEGRVTAFIGPSGCGKSTLLRTFNRMCDLDRGQRAEGERCSTAWTSSRALWTTTRSGATWAWCSSTPTRSR